MAKKKQTPPVTGKPKTQPGMMQKPNFSKKNGKNSPN